MANFCMDKGNIFDSILLFYKKGGMTPPFYD